MLRRSTMQAAFLSLLTLVLSAANVNAGYFCGTEVCPVGYKNLHCYTIQSLSMDGQRFGRILMCMALENGGTQLRYGDLLLIVESDAPVSEKKTLDLNDCSVELSTYPTTTYRSGSVQLSIPQGEQTDFYIIEAQLNSEERAKFTLGLPKLKCS